ncbi:MAG TPA: ergothioneine biosynthesis protein EgtB [Solirubrobacteraceae bacterium]|nr:ergothioneine biosynthesis protein EgtB [Solirubrobacteraceae bacterium]
MTGSIAATATPTATRIVEALHEARRRTFALIASVSDDDLERVHSPLMSPLAWDLAHIAAYEDLWLVNRYGERPLLRDDLAAMYDAFETPRAVRGDLPLLGPAQAREYLDEVRSRTLEVIDERGIGDGSLHEMVLRHEHQHDETMLQTLMLARLDGYELAGRRPMPESLPSAATGLDMIEIAAGECTIGATPDGFAYDNERPRHRTDVPGYLIGRTPVTNASYLTFVEGGGYQRREWWTDEGWAWKEQYDITRPGAWTADLDAEWRLGGLEPLHPDRPVVHVSWFEADAFARAHDARLPTETEWEKAATWDQEKEIARRYPWGNRRPAPGQHANLDHRGCGTAPVDAYPDGSSAYGCRGMIGDVWEWTSTLFDGYPGFVAHPYKEYSEVFFGPDYRVLRGGSWATRTRVATSTFRNWDYPQRRQIFSGFRIARDA